MLKESLSWKPTSRRKELKLKKPKELLNRNNKKPMQLRQRDSDSKRRTEWLLRQKSRDCSRKRRRDRG